MIQTPMGVVQVKVYDTDTEYKMAEEIRYLKHTKKNCKKTMFFLMFVIVAIFVTMGIVL